MATTHTFGPWIAEDLQIVGKFNRQSIATIVLAGNSRQMMRANARLIAAAPDLLLTLQIAKCVVELNTGDGARDWPKGTPTDENGQPDMEMIASMARAAIALAKGA